jgi:tetratricopeptide (TPR) repeat protein
MRILIALVAGVSLTAIAFAAGEQEATNWAAVHTAGLEADQRLNHLEAIEDFQQSWRLARTTAEHGVSANDLGQAYRQLGQSKEAKQWLERACDIWRAEPEAGRYLAISASSLGDVYRDAGDYARAETLLREALAAKNDNLASADMIRNALGDLVREQGRFNEAAVLLAETLHREGIAWRERVNALAGLADIDRQTGDWRASEEKWNEALAIGHAQNDRTTEAVASRGLASMWVSAGNLARAEPLFRRALSILESDPAAAPDTTASVLSGLAGLYRQENKLALAEDAWARALELDRAAFGDLHPQVAILTEMLADVYAARGERELARDYATRAVEAMKCLFGEDTLPTAVALANRATVEQRGSELNAAAGDFEHALSIARRQRREERGNELLEKTMTERYAVLLKSMHRNREARALLSNGLSANALSFRQEPADFGKTSIK